MATIIGETPAEIALRTGQAVPQYDNSGNYTGQNVISSANTKTVPTVTVPPPPTDTNNYNGIVASGSTLIPAPVTEDPQKALKDYAALLGTPPSAADAYNTAYNDTGIADKQKIVNNLTAQLNSIIAEGQAANLNIEGNAQGTYATSGAIGNEQAARSRQTAIKSLPIQAQLAAAQGNLTLATDKLNTLFKLKSDDITNQYNYKKDLLQKNYDIMTTAQKDKADAKQKADDRVYNVKIDAMNNAQAVAKSLLDTQPQLSAQIGAIDWVKDPNAQTKYNDLIKQVRAKETTTNSNGASTKPLDILDIGRWQTAYPSAGITAGDSEATATVKVQALSVPKTYTEADLTSQFTDAKTQKISYDQVLQDIDNNVTIANKDLAKQAAAKVYGVKVAQPIMGTGNFATTSLDDALKQKQDQNVKMGFAKNTGLREELYNAGYPIEEIDNRLNYGTKILNSISGFLFGKK